MIAPCDLFLCFCISRPAIKGDHILKTTTTELPASRDDGWWTTPLEWMINGCDISKRKKSTSRQENGGSRSLQEERKDRAFLWRANLVWDRIGGRKTARRKRQKRALALSITARISSRTFARPESGFAPFLAHFPAQWQSGLVTFKLLKLTPGPEAKCWNKGGIFLCYVLSHCLYLSLCGFKSKLDLDYLMSWFISIVIVDLLFIKSLLFI